MLSYTFAFIVFALIFGMMDFVWLTTALGRVYQPAIGEILAEKVRLLPAAAFYLIYVSGVSLFVVAPSLGAGDWRQAGMRGAAFGLVAYATYDLTNQATLRTWPTRLTLIDMGWGVFATAVAAGLTVLVTHRVTAAMGWN
jgi:uncharacterized membrane protein